MYFWIINISLVFLLCVFFAGILIPKILHSIQARYLFLHRITVRSKSYLGATGNLR